MLEWWRAVGRALLISLTGAAALWAAFPGAGIWPLAYPGIALSLIGLRGLRIGQAALVGLITGWAFFGAHISWATVFLGPVPWAALTSVMALWWSAMSALIATVLRAAERARARVGGSARVRTLRRVLTSPLALAVATAGLVTAREAVQSVWPYGGFAWGRLAQSQSEAPTRELVSWLGVSGLSFAMVLAVALVVESFAAERRRGAPRARRFGAPAAVTVAAALVMTLVPQYPIEVMGERRIAGLQGGTELAGYFSHGTRQQVLDAHLSALDDRVAHEHHVDLVVWPESATEFLPFTDAALARRLRQASGALGGASMLGGAIVEDDAGALRNTAFVWPDEGEEHQFYAKRHPVPFGEYVPDREFWRLFAPDLIDMVGREYTAGTGNGLLRFDNLTAGVGICFDIVDDGAMRGSVAAGAEVLLLPTNNADFGRTDESAQQLAIARLRAVETGRAAVNASTVGESAIIAPSGETLAEIEWYTPGFIVADVPLSSTLTPAVRFGRAIELLLSGLGLVAAAIGTARLVTDRRRRRGGLTRSRHR